MTRVPALCLAAVLGAGPAVLAGPASATSAPAGRHFEWSTKSPEAKKLLAELQSRIESFQFGPSTIDLARKLAAAKLAHEKPGQTLQPTVLVHEAYLRLVDTAKPQQWNGRGHFFGAAAEAISQCSTEARAGWETCPTGKEAPVGVEPTMADLQSAALATWLQRHKVLLPESLRTWV